LSVNLEQALELCHPEFVLTSFFGDQTSFSVLCVLISF